MICRASQVISEQWRVAGVSVRAVPDSGREKLVQPDVWNGFDAVGLKGHSIIRPAKPVSKREVIAHFPGVLPIELVFVVVEVTALTRAGGLELQGHIVIEVGLLEGEPPEQESESTVPLISCRWVVISQGDKVCGPQRGPIRSKAAQISADSYIDEVEIVCKRGLLADRPQIHSELKGVLAVDHRVIIANRWNRNGTALNVEAIEKGTAVRPIRKLIRKRRESVRASRKIIELVRHSKSSRINVIGVNRPGMSDDVRIGPVLKQLRGRIARELLNDLGVALTDDVELSEKRLLRVQLVIHTSNVSVVVHPEGGIEPEETGINPVASCEVVRSRIAAGDHGHQGRIGAHGRETGRACARVPGHGAGVQRRHLGGRQNGDALSRNGVVQTRKFIAGAALRIIAVVHISKSARADMIQWDSSRLCALACVPPPFIIEEKE